MGLDVTIIGQMKNQKWKSEFLPLDFLKKFFAKCEDQERVFKVFAIVLYEMVIFSKVLNHIEAVVVDLVEQVVNWANPVPIVITETIHFLNSCHRKGEGQFIRCVQLLYVCIRSHF